MTSAQEALYLFRTMARIRALEIAVDRLVIDGEVRGLVHTSIGNEASAAGVCAAMKSEDWMLSGHRAHGHVLARGADMGKLVAEICGRANGLCGGLGGSMHLVDIDRGTIGATGVVGGNISMALGAAYSAELQNSGAVAVVFFGDGATGTGQFHESLNLAALWHLPVLFVCENNTVSEFTSRSQHSVVEDITDFAAPYSIPAEKLVATDVLLVLDKARQGLEYVRNTPGPMLLELETRRLVGHYAGDVRGGHKEGQERWDPMIASRSSIVAAGVDDVDLDRIIEEAEHEVAEAVQAALASPPPKAATAMAAVYATKLDCNPGVC